MLSRGRTALGLRHNREAPKEQRSRRLTSSLRLRARPPGDPIKVQGKPPVASQTITSKGVPAVHLTQMISVSAIGYSPELFRA